MDPDTLMRDALFLARALAGQRAALLQANRFSFRSPMQGPLGVKHW